ncbi:PAS domain-containing protein [Nannocystis exedens]|uniref:histidine kinase n=1 Tax=Nannocystis exedens TaxID=54 RepID=A0A1I2GW92_9BACT|nr:ATP-binding protein [Nannocystis exedens]PCC74089.1 histidine kinase [Nannocystis exedens]SFF20896.1 PAS domain-containing protein [Nannocystis exedens]
MRGRRRRALAHETRVLLLAFAGGAPALVLALALLFVDDHSAKVRWTCAALVVGAWLGGTLALHARVVRSLRVVSGLLAALREEDFSMRGRVEGGRGDDALSEVMREINGLGDTLREQRLGAFEAGALLRTVMEEIDVAVLAFDDAGHLRLANRAAERLLGGGAGLLGRDAASLGLAACLAGEAPRTLLTVFPGGAGPWELRRSRFRQRGLPHTLLVLTDVRRALREEERQAWQRLVRVLGHEINNSLAPIRSIADNLRQQLTAAAAERPDDFDDDLARGLDVITRRSEGLARFLAAYARLARLPRPRLGEVDVAAWVARVVALERRVAVTVRPGPDAVVRADGDQLDQLLINLLRNAADAAQSTGAGAGVEVSWSVDGGALALSIVDEGPGLAETANLFVPFFTTKPDGSGIGLVLSRQIAEAHGGSLSLLDRGDGRPGCEARVRLADARTANRARAG